jgi:hypothetical protein
LAALDFVGKQGRNWTGILSEVGAGNLTTEIIQGPQEENPEFSWDFVLGCDETFVITPRLSL